MDESKKLYRQLKELEAEMSKAQKRKAELLEDRETQTVISRLITAERLLDGSDPSLSHLQAQIAEKKKLCSLKERDSKAKYRSISKELQTLTGPVIAKGIERVYFELLPLKVEKRIVSRDGGGFSMRPQLVVETNEDGIAEVQKIVREAMDALNQMRLSPVKKIEDFISEQLKAIRSVDFGMRRKTVDEFEHTSREWGTFSVRNLGSV